jgi:hypothetical protein
VTHSCNPSYSGGRDQEDRSSKAAQTNSLQDYISKIPFTKKGWWNGSRCRPEFKPQYCKKKKENQDNIWTKTSNKSLTSIVAVHFYLVPFWIPKGSSWICTDTTSNWCLVGNHMVFPDEPHSTQVHTSYQQMHTSHSLPTAM